MAIKMKRKGTRIDDKVISAFEQRIGTKLPNDYRTFLAENNGGVPEENEFAIPGLNGCSGINELLSVNEIEDTKERLNERFLLNALPIAYAEGGNYLCLVLGKQSGIYFWDHELEAEEGQLPSWDNMFRITDTFTDFWTLLKPFNINNVELKPDQARKVWVNPNFKPEFD